MKAILMERLGCSEKEAQEIAQDLAEISDELKGVRDAWLDNSSYDGNVSYYGYSIHSLMEDFDMKFTGALLTLDWLIKQPEEARKALSYGIR